MQLYFVFFDRLVQYEESIQSSICHVIPWFNYA